MVVDEGDKHVVDEAVVAVPPFVDPFELLSLLISHTFKLWSPWLFSLRDDGLLSVDDPLEDDESPSCTTKFCCRILLFSLA